MRLQKLLGVVGMLALFFCTNGWAQVSGGAISGSVLDASGSAIGNAKVKIMNVDTGCGPIRCAAIACRELLSGGLADGLSNRGAEGA
jgi:hypothetical protein